MSEFRQATVGSVFRHTEDGVEIDGHFVPAITVLEASRHWRRFAAERGWTLRNNRGYAIVWEDG